MLNEYAIECIFQVSQSLFDDFSQCKHLKYKISEKSHPEDLSFLQNNGYICKQCILLLFADCYYRRSPEKLFVPAFAASFYPNVSKFVFHETNIWLDIMMRIPFFIKCIEINRKMIIRLHYEILFILNNLTLLKNKHWNILTFKSSFMMQIIVYIEKEYLYRIRHIHQKCKVSFKILEELLVFVAKWFAYFVRVKQRKQTQCIIPIYRKLKSLISTLTVNRTRSRKSSEIMLIRQQYLNLVKIGNPPQIKIVYQYARKYRKLRKNNQQCQRFECDKRRKNVNKFYKCSACFVVMYCSKKCAKLDWKNGKHREICQEYSGILFNLKWDSDPEYRTWRSARVEIFKRVIDEEYSIF